LPFYHGIFSALFSFSTVRHRRGIANGEAPLAQELGVNLEQHFAPLKKIEACQESAMDFLCRGLVLLYVLAPR
jgi:hypothetical protein